MAESLKSIEGIEAEFERVGSKMNAVDAVEKRVRRVLGERMDVEHPREVKIQRLEVRTKLYGEADPEVSIERLPVLIITDSTVYRQEVRNLSATLLPVKYASGNYNYDIEGFVVEVAGEDGELWAAISLEEKEGQEITVANFSITNSNGGCEKMCYKEEKSFSLTDLTDLELERLIEADEEIVLVGLVVKKKREDYGFREEYFETQVVPMRLPVRELLAFGKDGWMLSKRDLQREQLALLQERREYLSNYDREKRAKEVDLTAAEAGFESLWNKAQKFPKTIGMDWPTFEASLGVEGLLAVIETKTFVGEKRVKSAYYWMDKKEETENQAISVTISPISPEALNEGRVIKDEDNPGKLEILWFKYNDGTILTRSWVEVEGKRVEVKLEPELTARIAGKLAKGSREQQNVLVVKKGRGVVYKSREKPLPKRRKLGSHRRYHR